MTAPVEAPSRPPPPPRRRPVPAPVEATNDTSRLFNALFVTKGVLTAASALAVMLVIPWVTGSLETAIAESNATLPPAFAWVLARPWVLYLVALQALVSGVLMVAVRRGRMLNLVLSTISLLALVLFLGVSLMMIIRSVAAAAGA